MKDEKTTYNKKKTMLRCSICGKILIERKSNGLFKFFFGKGFTYSGGVFVPVEIFIHGNIKMRCLRRSCRKQNPNHWNVFNFWPGSQENVAIELDSNSKTTPKKKGD